jgi:hypothetical protein
MLYQRHKMGIQHKMEDGLSMNWKLSQGFMAPFVAPAHFEAHSTSDRSDDVRRFDGREILFDAESKYFVRFDVLTAVVVKSSVFWDMTPCSLLKGNRCLLAICFMLISCLVYSSALKMEATCSSEASTEFQRTTWRYIPED